MAAIFETVQSRLERNDDGDSPQVDGLPEDILAPIVAGAFARGIAEAFNLLGVPALFFDRAGHVLFVSEAANRSFASDLMLQSGHLLASSRADNHALATFMADVLLNPDGGRSVTLACAGLTLSSRSVPGGFASTDQLLHAIVLVGRADVPSDTLERTAARAREDA